MRYSSLPCAWPARRHCRCDRRVPCARLVFGQIVKGFFQRARAARQRRWPGAERESSGRHRRRWEPAAQAALDSVQARFEHGGKGEVGIALRSGSVAQRVLLRVPVSGVARARAERLRCAQQMYRGLITRVSLVAVDRRGLTAKGRAWTSCPATNWRAGADRLNMPDGSYILVAPVLVSIRLWWTCIPLPLIPKTGLGMKVAIRPCLAAMPLTDT